jgi:hypothetical protein
MFRRVPHHADHAYLAAKERHTPVAVTRPPDINWQVPQSPRLAVKKAQRPQRLSVSVDISTKFSARLWPFSFRESEAAS